MAKVDKAIPEEIPIEEAPAVIQEAVAAQAPAAAPLVPFPKTDEERAALENELTNYSRKAVAKMPPEEAAAFYTRRYHVCLALDGFTYDRTAVRIPTREAEREALEHELENPTCYPPNKHVELMTRGEEQAWRIRRRQIMFALRGEPDDTTHPARELVKRCC